MDILINRIRYNDKYSKRNKRISYRFIRFCLAEGLSRKRIDRIIYYLDKLNDIMKPRNFDDLNKPTAEILWGNINLLDYSDWTKSTFKAFIKKFYRWMGDRYIKQLKFKNGSPKTRILPQDLFTRQEIEDLLENATLEMRCLYSILYESGARMGEVMNLYPRDIQFNGHGCIITLRGKTGIRNVQVIEIAGTLEEYLKRVPKTQKLFPKIHYTYSQRLKRDCERIGITKRVYPHLFRHTRASYLAQHLTESQLKKYFGWTMNTQVLETYIHLRTADVNKAIIRLHQHLNTHELKI